MDPVPPKTGAILFAESDLKWIADPKRPGTFMARSTGRRRSFRRARSTSSTGKKPHIAKCDTTSGCVMTVDVRGKWDAVSVKKSVK